MSEPTTKSGQLCRRLVHAGLVVIFGLSGSHSLAQQDGDFKIMAASASAYEGVYYLNATIDYRLNDTALEALARGVSLTFELSMDVRRVQRWRPDKSIAELLQLYELQYHALSERYIVRNLNSGEQQSFQTLSAALLELGNVHDLPFIDQALLSPKRSYVMRIKSILDIRSLPGPLRLLAIFFGDWRLASDWYQWSLR